jgi:Recombination endonuclease VII
MTPRDRYLRKTYGITEAQYNELLAYQGGCCAICRKPPKGRRLAVDHDHKTGKVRGLLCYFCNSRFLGRGRESAAMHLAAAEYLERPPWQQMMS